MGNMAYCRFENTVRDLQDCFDFWEEAVGDGEKKARARLLKLCKEIVKEYGDWRD